MNAQAVGLKQSPKQAAVKLFDRDKIDKSLKSETFELPKGLSFEEMRKHMMEAARS